METPQKVRIALVQMKSESEPAANLSKAIERVREAADLGAKIISLQELFRSDYFCQEEKIESFDLAEEIPGPSTKALCEVAREKNVVIIASLFEKRTAGLYHNTACVIDADGTLLGLYRKMHIPDDPGFYEKFYFTPGDLGFKTFPTKYADVGVLVCWDQWYPEAARLTALSGAQILFYPTAIGWARGERDEVKKAQHDAWETIQRGHAIANGVFVAAANRVGSEGNLDFWGQSFIANPFGQLLSKGSAVKEEIIIAECDFKDVDLVRRHWPFLRDRRIEEYGDIGKRFLK